MAFTTLDAVAANLQAKATALSGVRDAPVAPLAAADWKGAFAVSYLRTVNWTGGQPVGVMTAAWATFVTEIHVIESAVPQRDYAILTPFALALPGAIWLDPDLGKDVDRVDAVRVAVVPSQYAGVKTSAVVFEVDVKIQLVL